MSTDFSNNLMRFAQEQYSLQEEILRGSYGAPGEPFMTTRKLAEQRGVSIVTAHNIMKGLCDAGFIELRGKKYYLSHSKLAESYNNRTMVIGLIIPSISNEFYDTIAEAVIKSAEQKGYRVLVLTTSYSPAEEKRSHELLVSLKVAGIISCVPVAPENINLYRDCPVPCILLSHTADGSHRSSVQVNSFSISQKVAQHLIKQGYKSFLYVGTQNIPIETDIRYAAFHMELNSAGFSLGKSNVVLLSQKSKIENKALTNMLSQQEEPVGIFCHDDLIAVQLYRICKKLGKNIPQDVGIVGFDDLSIAAYLSPALTTVQYRIPSMADMALKLLLKSMKNPNSPYDNYYIEPVLIVRESTDLPSDDKA